MCPPCVIWTTHNAVMCVLHVIQKTICTDLCLYRLCVSDRFSVPWGSDIKFLRMKDTRKSPFGFVIFVLAVEVGVLFQINMIFLFVCFGVRSDAVVKCVGLCLWGPHLLPCLLLCCQFFQCGVFPHVSSVWPQSAPKILLSTVMLNSSEDFSSCECF